MAGKEKGAETRVGAKDKILFIAPWLIVVGGIFLSAMHWTPPISKTWKGFPSYEVITRTVTGFLWLGLTLLVVWRNRRKHVQGKAEPGKVAIWVAELEGDDKEGTHRTHIIRTLRWELGESVQILRAGIELHVDEKGNVEDDAYAANHKGQRYLNANGNNGDLLIWGRVIKEEKLVELRFASPAHDGAEQKRFTFTEKMLLAQDFGPELAAALAAIAAQLALPANETGRYVADALIPVAERLGKIVANLPASMGPDQRGLLERSYADAERAIGEQRGDSEALERAIAAYQDALKEHTRERVPLDWAMIQNNLGLALFRLGERESGKDKLEAAVTAYREALKIRTREKVPFQWAATQNNLGNAFLRLGERESGTESLEAAVAAYREALKIRTREKVPLEWAGTQNNLGLALRVLGEREGGTELLKAAVAAYREALKEWTREKVPLDWAMTQNNLGNVLSELGAREDGTERLEAAVAAFREALKERTREKVPLDWAITQNNLGNALSRLGGREGGAERLEEAADAYRLALELFTHDGAPLQWAMTQNNLDKALSRLREREGSTDRLVDLLQSSGPIALNELVMRMRGGPQEAVSVLRKIHSEGSISISGPLTERILSSKGDKEQSARASGLAILTDEEIMGASDTFIEPSAASLRRLLAR